MCWLPVNLCSFGRALGKVLSTPRKIHPGVLSELRKSGQSAQGQPGVLACDKVGWCRGKLSVLKPSKEQEGGRLLAEV